MKRLREIKMEGPKDKSSFNFYKKWIILWGICLAIIVSMFFLIPGYRNRKYEKVSSKRGESSKTTPEVSLLEKRFSQIEDEVKGEDIGKVEDKSQDFELISKTDDAEIIYLGKAFERVALVDIQSFLDNSVSNNNLKKSNGHDNSLSSETDENNIIDFSNKKTPDTTTLAGIPGQIQPGIPSTPGASGPGDIVIQPIGDGPPVEDPGNPPDGDPGKAPSVDITKIDPNRPNFDVLVKNKLQTASVVAEEQEYVPGEVLIKYKQDAGMSVYDFQDLTTAEVESIEPLFKEEMGVQSTTSTTGLENIYRMKINKDANVEAVCDEIRLKNSNIEYVEPNYIYKIMANPGDDPLFNQLWGIKKIQAPEAWGITDGSRNITVAVVDTGVDINHEDLHDNASGDMDVHYHGTHVAGTIAAVDNDKGVIGVAPKCRILGIQVLNSGGSGSTADIAQGIRRAVASGARVINLSLGGGGDSQAMHDAIKDAYNKNVVVVAAAGNGGGDGIGDDAKNTYPASYEEVICVAATNQNDEHPVFSNWGDVVDVAAPGVAIMSCKPGNQYQNLAGTSMATPHVCGVVALMLSLNPDLTVDDVKNILYQSADDIGSSGKDIYFGYGRVNAYKAVNSVDTVKGLKAEITYPTSDVTLGSQITVKGTASGDAFNDYYLELENVNSKTKISLGNKVYQKVDAGILLDKYDVGSMTPGEYIIRLIVEDGQGGSIKREQKVYLGMQLEFPYKLPGYITSGIKIADIDGDGADEVIFMAAESYVKQIKVKNTYLYVINNDGTVRKGFPVLFQMRSWATPALADLDGDGKLEIVVTGTKEEEGGFTSFITAVKSDGSVFTEPGHAPVDVQFAGITPSSPVVSDIDNDGEDEIICSYMYPGTSTAHYQKIMVVKADGSASELNLGLQPAYKAYYPLTLQACTPVVADIDGDGKNEILVSDVIDPATGDVYLLAAYDSNGNVKYSVKDPENNLAFYSRIVAGDLYGTGSREVVLVRATDRGDRIYVINNRFEIDPGWPKKFDQQFDFYEPVLLDIDGDNNLEIFVKAKDKIYAWHHDGTDVSGWPIDDKSGSLEGMCFGMSAIERIIGNNIYKRDGSVGGNLSFNSAGITSDLVMDHGIGELNSDSPGPEMAVVVVGEDGYEYLDVVTLEGVTQSSNSKWPMFKLNMANNAVKLTEGGSPGVPGNHPPQFINFDTFRVTGSETLEIKLDDYANDDDGDALEFSVENKDALPGETSFDSDTNTFYWNPPDNAPGGYSGVKFIVTDPYGGKDEATPLFEYIQ